jgi:hypothetical protein
MTFKFGDVVVSGVAPPAAVCDVVWVFVVVG